MASQLLLKPVPSLRDLRIRPLSSRVVKLGAIHLRTRLTDLHADQAKEPHLGLPKMARSNTTRVPRKEDSLQASRLGMSHRRGIHRLMPTWPTVRDRTSLSLASNLVLRRLRLSIKGLPPSDQTHLTLTGHSQVRTIPFASNERISTPYATSGGEKTYFTSSGLGRAATARDGPTSGDIYDSEPAEGSNPHTRSASAYSPARPS